jgi:ATP-dependent helicase HrpA
MAALDLGEVAGFPFIDPPDTRQVTDGVRLLSELGAVRPEGKGAKSLTGIGKKLARLPVDPRLGRMIIEAGGNDCAREVLIIAAALSIQDPRERPADSREAADAQHVRFAEPGSDFLSLLNLWDYLRDQQRELSGSAFRRMCRREYLHYLRVREWQDVYGQLRQAARELGITVGPDRTPAVAAAPAAAAQPSHGGPTAHVAQLAAKPGSEVSGRIPDDLGERVHRSLLAGLLSHIGMRDVASGERRRGPAEFLGARSARFAIFPDSVLARKPPQWVVAAELVETSRLWARVTARIEPEWAEPLAAHLIKREYSEPHWDGRRGAAMAFERVSLYGLPLVARRRVTLSSIDPVLARELFISQGLVEGDWQTHHKFFHRNRQLLAEAEELELRARRRGIVADDAALFAFYDRRIPPEVTSARHFDSWWKRARQAEPDLLTLTEADLAGPASDEVEAEDYPSTWGGLALSYEFAPGEADDGVTAEIPLAALNQVSADEFSWNVPGLRLELVTELIRTLPKQLRTRFVPAPDVARDVLSRLDPGRGGLIGQLSSELGRLGGVSVPADAFDLAKLPPHLRFTFRVTDDGQVLASGKDLGQLRSELRPRLQERMTAAAGELTRAGITSWDFGELPRVFSHGQVRAYPALRDAGDSVEIALFETPEHAAESMLAGNRRLLLLQVQSGARAVASRLPTSAKLAMARHPYGTAGELVDDCAAAAADEIVMAAGGPAWDAETFSRLLDVARSSLAAKTADVVSVVARVLGEAHRVEAGLDTARGTQMAGAVADMRQQFTGLIHRGFIAEAGARKLTDLVRYLRAMTHRLEKAPADLRRDADRMEVVQSVTDEYHDALAKLGSDARYRPDVQAVRWMIEELRVSLFAPSIGAAGRVSEQRILTALDRL